MTEHLTLNKVRGMFMGAFMGDALGAPHEFACNKNTPYTGKLEHQGFLNTQYQGKKTLAVGQITDDSEMTLALLRAIIRDGGYNRDNVIRAYLDWANSGGWMMGKNTRALLKGVTTVKGYENRIGKILALPMEERSQSNGALMRCSSLALIWDNQPVVIDASITNPTNVVIDCNLVYISALRLALEGEQGPVIFEKVLPIAQTKEVKEVLAQVQARRLRDIKSNKGWCLHGLWCAMMAITSFTSYTEAMRWIITSQIGSDTDTNACIAGALLGAILGFDAIRAEPDMEYNISVILSDNSMKGPTPRPVEYGISDFYELTAKAAVFLNH